MPSPANENNLFDANAATQGSTFQASFILKDPAGNLINLTSSTAKMQVRVSVPDGTLIVEVTSPVVSGKGIALGALGEIDIIIPATETWTVDDALLARPERYPYELLVTTAGIVGSESHGLLEALPGIARPPP